MPHEETGRAISETFNTLARGIISANLQRQMEEARKKEKIAEETRETNKFLANLGVKTLMAGHPEGSIFLEQSGLFKKESIEETKRTLGIIAEKAKEAEFRETLGKVDPLALLQETAPEKFRRPTELPVEKLPPEFRRPELLGFEMERPVGPSRLEQITSEVEFQRKHNRIKDLFTDIGKLDEATKRDMAPLLMNMVQGLYPELGQFSGAVPATEMIELSGMLNKLYSATTVDDVNKAYEAITAKAGELTTRIPQFGNSIRARLKEALDFKEQRIKRIREGVQFEERPTSPEALGRKTAEELAKEARGERRDIRKEARALGREEEKEARVPALEAEKTRARKEVEMEFDPFERAINEAEAGIVARGETKLTQVDRVRILKELKATPTDKTKALTAYNDVLSGKVPEAPYNKIPFEELRRVATGREPVLDVLLAALTKELLKDIKKGAGIEPSGPSAADYSELVKAGKEKVGAYLIQLADFLKLNPGASPDRIVEDSITRGQLTKEEGAEVLKRFKKSGFLEAR